MTDDNPQIDNESQNESQQENKGGKKLSLLEQAQNAFTKERTDAVKNKLKELIKKRAAAEVAVKLVDDEIQEVLDKHAKGL